MKRKGGSRLLLSSKFFLASKIYSTTPIPTRQHKPTLITSSSEIVRHMKRRSKTSSKKIPPREGLVHFCGLNAQKPWVPAVMLRALGADGHFLRWCIWILQYNTWKRVAFERDAAIHWLARRGIKCTLSHNFCLMVLRNSGNKLILNSRRLCPTIQWRGITL